MTDQKAASETNDRHEEFVVLLTAAHDRLLGYLMSLLGRWHDAQDVLQRSSLSMWQKFETFDAGSNFDAWASTICFYEAKNFQRLTARSPLQFDDDLLATLSAERLEDLSHQQRRLAALQLCVDQLGTTERDLVRAAYEKHGGVAGLATRLNRCSIPERSPLGRWLAARSCFQVATTGIGFPLDWSTTKT